MELLDQIYRTLCRAGRFLRLLVNRFIADQGLPNTASLAYTTLLSLVPLMTVSLAIFAIFPSSGEVTEQLQDFVFKNFVPASGELVQQYLLEFSSKASRLSGVGFLFLILVAVMMMANIDQAINSIWRVRRKRRPLSTFLMYWSILSLGPLLIGLSVAVTSFLVSVPIISDTAESLGLGRRLLAYMPMLASLVAFTLLYAVVPNRRVVFVHALGGGVLAALLFELSKRGFALYVAWFPTYQAIYGALAAIPIFLVWIYLSWLVTLLGAEFAYCLSIFNDHDRQRRIPYGGELLLAYRLMRQLWLAQQQGHACSLHSLSRQLGRVSDERLELLLEQLQRARLVLTTAEREWALARELSAVSLQQLYAAGPFILPPASAIGAAGEVGEPALAALLLRLEGGMKEAMSLSLEQLFLDDRQDPESDQLKALE